MESMKSLEGEIKKKLENAFDVRHIYEIFSSLVTAINEQNEEIDSLRQELGDTKALCQELANRVKTVEFNIQGFDANVPVPELKILDIVDIDIDPAKGYVKRTTSAISEKKKDSRPPTAQKRDTKADRTEVKGEKIELKSRDPSNSRRSSGRVSPLGEKAPTSPTASRKPSAPASPVEDIKIFSGQKERTESLPISNAAATAAATAAAPAAVLPVPTKDKEDPKLIPILTPTPIPIPTPVIKSPKLSLQNIETSQLPLSEVTQPTPLSPEISPPPLETPQPPITHRLSEICRLSTRAPRTPREEIVWRAKKRNILRHMYAKMTFLINVTNAAQISLTNSMDPKMTINHRIRDLETSVKALQSLASAQRKALDAVPARIKSYLPSDLKSQVARLTNVLDRMESRGSSNRSVASAPINANATGSINSIPAINVEGRFNEDCLRTLANDLKEHHHDLLLSHALDSPHFHEKLSHYHLNDEQSSHVLKFILQDHILKKLAHRMIDNGYLDDNDGNGNSNGDGGRGRGRGNGNGNGMKSMMDEEYEDMVRKQQTLGIVQEVTNKLISKEELSFVFENVYQQTSNTPTNNSNNVNLINRSPSGDSLSLSVSRSLSIQEGSGAGAGGGGGGGVDDDRNIIIPKSNVSEIVQRSSENKQLSRMASGSANDPSATSAASGAGAGAGGSNFAQRRKVNVLKGNYSDDPILFEMSDRFRQVLSHAIQHHTSDLTRRQEFDEKCRHLQTIMNLELMNLKKELMTEIVTKQIEGNVIKKMNKLEKLIQENVTSLNNFDGLIRNQMTEMERMKGAVMNRERANETRGWKPELEKMNKQLSQNLLNQKEFSETLLKDLEALQTDISNRIDEKRLEDLISDIESRIQKGVLEGIDPVQNNIASIARAVRSKADRKEMERLVALRIAETEDTLKKLELDHDAAGVTRCISCGNIGKPTSPSHSHSQFHSHSYSGLDGNPELQQQSLLSWGANGGGAAPAGGEYDQVMAVLNRQAGLKPLNRHSKPMLPIVNLSRPVTATGAVATGGAGGGSMTLAQSSTTSSKKEPLYRRAKAANQLRETPKIPLVNFTPNSSLSTPAEVYHLESKREIPSGGNNNNSNTHNNGSGSSRGSLPKGFASRPLSGV